MEAKGKLLGIIPILRFTSNLEFFPMTSYSDKVVKPKRRRGGRGGKGVQKRRANKLAMEVKSPLMIAARNYDLEQCNRLLEGKADVLTTTSSDYSALYYACFPSGDKELRKKQLPVIELLVEKKANINHQQEYGFSALMALVNDWNIEGMRILLKAGADPHLKNYLGKTAIDLADEYKDKKPEMLEVLMEHIGKSG